tara:strand:- start:7504 stop:7818 length:315 start_codon:yes stop_codon:yes gene_type:complete
MESTQEPTWTELADFEPLLSVEQVEEQEPDSWGPSRRMMLITLTKSGKQLLDSCQMPDGGDMAADMVDMLDAYKVQLEALMEMTEAARSRLLVVANAAIEQQPG